MAHYCIGKVSGLQRSCRVAGYKEADLTNRTVCIHERRIIRGF